MEVARGRSGDAGGEIERQNPSRRGWAVCYVKAWGHKSWVSDIRYWRGPER